MKTTTIVQLSFSFIFKMGFLTKGVLVHIYIYLIYSSECPRCLFSFLVLKGGHLFERGTISREALIKCIKKTSKYFQFVSLIKQ